MAEVETGAGVKKDQRITPQRQPPLLLPFPLSSLPSPTIPFHLGDVSAESHDFIDPYWVRFPKEMGCAMAASILVSPMVSIIDKSIVKEISGITTLFKELRLETIEAMASPGKFAKNLAFQLTVIVYFGTYAVANVSEQILDEYKVAREEKRKQFKVSGTAAANIGLLAWRDSIFARIYSSPGTTKSKTPSRTISMFALRDFGTMAATFYFAPKAATYLIREHEVNKEVAQISMALVIPAISQYITAPLHIHAIDYFNRPSASMNERVAKVAEEFNKIAFIRAFRVLPAFGIGSYSNTKFRETFIRQPDLSMYWTRRVKRIAQHVAPVSVEKRQREMLELFD